MTLKVIGAGFGRTGTLSFKTALEKLGYVKCHHMKDVITSSTQAKQWYEISSGQNPDWDSVFEGYQACVDFPSANYYQQLAQYYPDAKVVLTLRTPQSWYKSAFATIYAINKLLPRWLQWVVPRFKHIHYTILNDLWNGKFNGRFEDRDYALGIFEQHIEEVKRVIPKERLLIMNVSEGWEPLCKFLGTAIPDEPFPNMNDSGDFQKLIRALKFFRVLPWLLAASVATLIATSFF